MSDRKPAPHVARAMAVAQAKPNPQARHVPPAPAARPVSAPAGRQPAPHLAAGLGRPAAPALQPSRPPERRPAPHLAAALPPPRPQPKLPPSPVGKAPSAAAPPQATRPGSGSAARPAAGQKPIQPYMVLGSASIWTAEPVKRPVGGYPYVLLGTARFKAQDRGKSRSEHGYLDKYDDNEARVKNAAPGFSIRLSDDHQMAIEHSNLNRRQPKAIYLSPSVFRSANQALATAGSQLTLVQTGKSLTVVRGWGWYLGRGDYQLLEVKPVFGGRPANVLPQNCDAIAGKIFGKKFQRGDADAGNALLDIVGKSRREALSKADLKAYAAGAYDDEIEAAGLNRFVAPSIGEAYMIASLTPSVSLSDQAKLAFEEDRPDEAARLYAKAGSQTWKDYSDHGRKKTLRWSFHYAAVVATSGNDRITLQNYARGDDRMENPDPRWFFQMYGAGSGQSFHEESQGDDYVNSLTMVARGVTKKV